MDNDHQPITPPQGHDLEPLTTEEIESFLVKKDNKMCPWCGGAHWGMHVLDNEETVPTGKAPGLRALSKIILKRKEGGGNTMSATISSGPENSLAVAVVECQECGHTSFFSYFTLMRLIRGGASNA